MLNYGLVAHLVEMYNRPSPALHLAATRTLNILAANNSEARKPLQDLNTLSRVVAVLQNGRCWVRLAVAVAGLATLSMAGLCTGGMSDRSKWYACIRDAAARVRGSQLPSAQAAPCFQPVASC